MALVVLLAAGLAGACARDEDTPAAPDPTIRRETTTTTAPAIDVTTVPETITVEYLDAVMDEIDHLLGEAIRTLVAEGGPTKNFQQKLDAVYDEPQLSDSATAIVKTASETPSGLRASPGDPTTEVRRIITARSDCVLVETHRSLAPLLRRDPPEASLKVFIALRSKTSTSDPLGANRTRWSLVLDANTVDGRDPRNPCA